MLRLLSRDKDKRTEALALLLRNMARLALFRDPVKIVAITGSVGKTTTKDYVSLVMKQKFAVRATIGNTNDRTGVPSTILNRHNIFLVSLLLRALPWIIRRCLFQKENGQFLVLEIGARNPGQIKNQVTVFSPYISIVTAVAPGHLERLGSIEAIAEEKSRIVSALTEDGVAILCADDPIVADMQTLHRGKTLLFGFTDQADVHMRVVSQSLKGIDAELTDGAGKVFLKFPWVTNRYHLYSIMSAWCAGLVTGIDREIMKKVLQEVRPTHERGTILSGREGTLILNDAFNANPLSMKAALETLSVVAADRRRVVVFSDMLELAHESELQHHQIGRQAGSVADLFITCGDFSSAYLSGFLETRRSGDTNHTAAGIHCRDLNEVKATLDAHLQVGDAILLKGSHGTGLYQMADEISRRFSIE